MFNHGFCRHYCTHAARRRGPELLKVHQFVSNFVLRIYIILYLCLIMDFAVTIVLTPLVVGALSC
jgi:hypothetical protein